MAYAARPSATDAIMNIVAATLIVAAAIGVRDAVTDPASPARNGEGRPYVLTPPPAFLVGMGADAKILLVGADDRESRGRADAIIVAYVNPRARRAALLSVQRDTLTPIPGHGEDKINHAYKYGGVGLLKTTVENLLGERIDGYAKLDFQTFKDVVDILGGVTVAVPDVEGHGRGMNYDDNADGLHVHLKPGSQRLDGEKAIGYVRYRCDSDFERTDRQREFIKALVRQHLRAGQIPEIARSAKKMAAEMDTDIPRGELVRLATAMSRIPPESVKTAMLPVTSTRRNGRYYSLVDREKAAEVKSGLADHIRGGGSAPVVVKECSIAVLNGSGIPGAAGVAANRIEKSGAIVTTKKNAPQFGHRSTEIRYHNGAKQAAEELKHILETPDAVLICDDEFDAPGAASIVITVGKDLPLS